MPPRLRIRSLQDVTLLATTRPTYICSQCALASTAAAATAATATTPIQASRFSPINPPSHRDPVNRKSQLLRQYVSLLQTTPVLILFQHNNLKAVEWASIRRELAIAMQKLDDGPPSNDPHSIADAIKLTVVRTNIFEPALRIAEYYRPTPTHDTATQSQGLEDEKLDPSLTHVLSENAYLAIKPFRGKHELSPLLNGSVAVLSFPVVSPAHVKAALQILAPKSPDFPPPTRRSTPGYYEPSVQDGLRKILMLGAKVEDRVFDIDGTRWVGSIDGGIDGLRAQIVGMLQGFAGQLTQTLDSAGRNLYFTVEGRRQMLEEEPTRKDA